MHRGKNKILSQKQGLKEWCKHRDEIKGKEKKVPKYNLFYLELVLEIVFHWVHSKTEFY